MNRYLIKNTTFYYTYYILIAIVAFWYWHPDEHYQIFEYASYKLGITPLENLAWEYKAQIRSGIQPLIAYIVSFVMIKLHIFNPFVVESICRVLITLFFLKVYEKLLDFFDWNYSTKLGYKVFTFAAFFWFLPTVLTRFSAECFGAVFFWIAFVILDYRKENYSIKNLLLAGFLMGIAFHTRIQLIVLIGVFFIWTLFYKKISVSQYLYVIIGFLLSIFIELGCNYWLYGDLIWTPYSYFKVNLIEGKASEFGTSPFYFYVLEFLKNLIPPISLIILTGGIGYMFKNKKSVFTWLLVFFFLAHSLIAHKEYRFLFPILPILIPMSLSFVSSFLQDKKWMKNVVTFILIVNGILYLSNFIIQNFNSYNYLRIYPKTTENSKIYTDFPCPYGILTDSVWYYVRPYFWKDKNCQIVEIDKIDTPIKINNLFTVHDHGPIYIHEGDTLNKTFQTISYSLIDVIPEPILSTIEMNYYYE